MRRVPQFSHGGTCTLLVEDGRILGVEPFAGPAPDAIQAGDERLAAIAAE